LWLCKAYANISSDPRKGANKKGAQFWEHVARQFAAFREVYLLEMEKDEKDDDNNPVVWVQRIGEDHSEASQKAQYTMPLRETMSGVAGTMISKQ
jgi:hypothetical protein